jgi:proteasome lid subunit RPN8/RPN11
MSMKMGTIVMPIPAETSEPLDDSSAEFLVHCPESIMREIINLAKKNSHTEILGRLVGFPFKTSAGHLRTLIQGITVAHNYDVSTRVSVQVSPAELAHMEAQFEASGCDPNLINVGWFHTHPGHGIFMSGTDKANHRAYEHEWQVALVIDPIREEYGFFVGKDCKPLGDVIICKRLDHTKGSRCSKAINCAAESPGASQPSSGADVK